MAETDINVIDMGDTTEAGLVFTGGSVDSAIMWEPELSEALESVEGAKAIVTSADYQNIIMDSLVVNTAYAEEHPEINVILLDENKEDSIYAISQKMADFWMEKGECETNDLTDFFALVK